MESLDPPRESSPAPRPEKAMRQPLAIRLTHWLNVLCLWLLLGSGLQIFNAHPFLYASDASDNSRIVLSLPQSVEKADGGERNEWILFGHPLDTGRFRMEEVGPRVTIGGWLAGARRWHLSVMWLFVLNGIAYAAYLFLSGEAKRRFFRPRDASGLMPMIRYYLRLGSHPRTEGYNSLQRLTYTLVVLVAGPLMILTGLAMSPQFDAHFPGYVALFGGRQFARTLHFTVMLGLVVFTAMHVVLVAASGWTTFWSMIAGGSVPEEAAHE